MGLRGKQIEMGINHPVPPIDLQKPEVQHECFLRVSTFAIHQETPYEFKRRTNLH